MNELIRVLLIEDKPDEALLLRISLMQAAPGQVEVTCADRLSAGLERSAQEPFDVVLLDLNLPDSMGLDTLAALHAHAPHLPIVVLSGLADDVTTLEAIRQGAQDYLVKGEISGPLVIRVLQYAIERRRVEAAQRKSEAQMCALCAAMADVVLVLDAEGRCLEILSTNPSLLYKSPAEVVGRTLHDVFPADQADCFLGHIRRALQTRETLAIDYSLEIDGAELWFSAKISPLSSDSVVFVATDITARKRAEAGLRRRAEELAALQSTVLQITAAHDLPTLLETIVERAALLLKAPSGGLYLDVPGRREVRCVVSYHTLRDYNGTVLQYGEGAAGVVAQTGQPLIVDDYRFWDKRATVFEEERPFTALLSAPMIWQGQVTGVIHVLDKVEGRRFTQADLELLTLFANHAAIAVENARLYEEAQRELAERQRVHEALRRSEEHLHQSQKMEAMGNMAGGLCHDFNNLLTVIVGNTLLLLEGLKPDHPHYAPLQAIYRTAIMAAESTRQLLAFSRCQYLEPKVLSLNDVVLETTRTAHRLIGEQITLTTTLAPDLGLVEIDPQSIKQAILNLIAQAREAMPQGGRLIIETANADLDQAYASAHPDVKPGRYVSLAVSDTGRGMDGKTAARIFEPFFTTIERGAGLQLAVVYGIVTQSGGHISVDSEVGLGATFKVYLPRVDAALCK